VVIASGRPSSVAVLLANFSASGPTTRVARARPRSPRIVGGHGAYPARSRSAEKGFIDSVVGAELWPATRSPSSTRAVYHDDRPSERSVALQTLSRAQGA